MQLGQLSIAGGFGLLGAILIADTTSLPAVAHIEYGPALFPSIVGGAMIVMSAIAAFDAVRLTPEPATPVEGVDPAGAAAPLNFANYAMFAAVIAAPLIYVLLVPTLGFLLSMPLIIGGLSYIASRKLMPSILLGIGLTILLHIVFYQVLKVSLPWGILTPYSGRLTW